MWICSYGVVNCPECKRTGEELTEISSADDKIYFRIKYDDKEAAKALGCRWDPQLKLWYSPLRNPNLVEIGKKWRVMQPQPAARANPPPGRAIGPRSPSRPAAAQAVARQMSLEALLDTPTVAQAEPEPKPGSVPYEEFMAAIRAADERDAQARGASAQQVRQHLMEPVTKETRK